MLRSIGLVVVSAALLAPGLAWASKGRVVAVHPLKALGVDEETVGTLEEILLGEIGRVPRVNAVPAEKARAAAKAADCDGKPACVAAFAKRAGAQHGVYGVVGGLGESYSITLKNIEVRRAKETHRVSHTVGGEREVLIDGIRAAAYQLLRPDLYVGSLDLQVPVEGAEVQLDGQSVGVTPLPGPIQGLAPGAHALKIVKKGFSDFDKFVEIRFQRESVVTVDLAASTVSGVIYRETEPPPLVGFDESEATETESAAVTPEVTEPPPPAAAPSRVLRWTGIGVGGAGVAALGGGLVFMGLANGTARDLEGEWNDRPEPGPTAADADAWERWKRQSGTSEILYVVGGVAAAAGAALFAVDLLTYREPTPSSPESTAEAAVAVGVMPLPDGVMAGVTVRY